MWEAIIQGVPQGERSELVFKVAIRLISLGYTDEEVFAVLINPRYGISARPLEELRRGNPSWIEGTTDKARGVVEREKWA